MEKITSEMENVKLESGTTFTDLPVEIISNIVKDVYLVPYLPVMQTTRQEKATMAVERHDIHNLQNRVIELATIVERDKKEYNESKESDESKGVKGSKETKFAKVRLNIAEKNLAEGRRDLVRKKRELRDKFERNKTNLMMLNRMESKFYDDPSKFLV